MDDALSEYLRVMIHEDFLAAVEAIGKGADPMEAHRTHEERCGPLRRLLAEQLERARIQQRSDALAGRMVKNAE